MAVGSVEGNLQAAAEARRAAAIAEKDAQSRITAATQRVREAEIESNNQLDKIRDQYNKEDDLERTRQTIALEAARNKGYENLRMSSMAQAKELARVEDLGRRQLQETHDRFADSLQTTEQKGLEDVTTLERHNLAREEYAKKTFENDFEHNRQEENKRLEALREQTQTTFTKESEASRAEIAREQENHALAGQQLLSHHQAAYKAALEGSQRELNDLNRRAGQQIEQSRSDSSRKLDAFSERNKDPFYQMLDLGTEFKESGDSYILSARIPPHEREHVTVTIRGNELILSGYRRNDDQQELTPGNTRRTSSFQSYSESFPLKYPVDAKGLEKRFEGENLIVQIPKRDVYTREQFQPKKTPPERLHVERPVFPHNLPIANAGEAPKMQDPAQSSQAGSGDYSGKPLG